MSLVIKHECKKCGKKFDLVSGETLVEDKGLIVRKDSRKELFLTKAACPVCGHSEIVQVDDEETVKIFSEMIKKVRAINICGKKSKRQSAQLANLNKRLNDKRFALMQEIKLK